MWPFKKKKYLVACFQDLAGAWHFRIQSERNAQPIATSEAYHDRWSMERTAILVAKEAKWEIRGLNEDFPNV